MSEMAREARGQRSLFVGSRRLMLMTRRTEGVAGRATIVAADGDSYYCTWSRMTANTSGDDGSHVERL